MTKSTTPLQTAVGGKSEYTLRELKEGDQKRLHAFAMALPQHDLLYLRRDITKRPVIEAWVKEAKLGSVETLIVEDEKDIVASAALIVDRKAWSRHVGEIRVLVANGHRKKGLGRYLVEKVFELALENGLRKIIAQMTIDQKGAISVFEEFGFSGEALLKDHVQDTAGGYHDIVILSCNVTSMLSRTALSR